MRNVLQIFYGLSVCIFTAILIVMNQFTWEMIGYLVLLLIPIVVLYKVLQVNKAEKKRLQHRIEDLLRNEKLNSQNLKELNQINNHLRIGYLSFDMNNFTVRTSASIEEIFGYTRDELQNEPFKWKEMTHPDDLGALMKQENELLIGKSIKYKHRVMRADGNYIWVHNSATPILDSNEKLIKVQRAFFDITKQKEEEEKLRQLAFYDNLTELPNRKMLEIQLKKALARSKRHDHSLIVMFIDLDGFKKVNDTFGHDYGDLLLKEVAERLTNSVREEDLIVRLGGDEFIVVFEETDQLEIVEIVERILKNVSDSYLINDEKISISPSIGMSKYPEDGEDRDSLIQNADKAMYYAKRKGKNNYQFYTSDLETLPPRKFEFFGKIVQSVVKMRG